MANVKITELTELAAIDVADNDVFPIVDVGGDTTKKITAASLKTSIAHANDFITYTQLNSNINSVQSNVVAAEANVVLVRSNVDSLGTYANTTFSTVSNAESLASEDVALQARIAANALVAASNDFATYTRLQANIDLVQDNVASVTVGTASDTETRLNANLDITNDNVTALTTTVDNFGTYANSTLDTKANVSATLFLARANDFATYTRLQANIDLVQDNVASVTVGTAADTETRLNANLDITNDNVSTLTTTVDNFGTSSNANATALALEDVALQTRLGANVISFQNEDTALQSRLATNVTAFTNEDTALQARIAANTLTAASNDFVTFTRLDSNINVVQDNVAAIIDGSTNFTGEVTMTDDLIVTGNLTVNGTTTTVASTNLNVTDRLLMLANGATGSPSADVGVLFNRGDQGNAAIFYDESATTFKLSDTKDPSSNTSLSPVTAANLDVGILTASTVKFDGADLSTAISDNVSTLNTSITALETRRTNNIAGAISTVTTSDLTASRALVSDGSGKLAVSDVTSTELGYLDGVTSDIQTQIDSKQATITGAATTIDDTNLTASRALTSDGSGKVAVSDVTSTELGYLDGVTSAIQTQLNSKIATTDSASNDFVTFTRLDANIDVVSSNATAVESRRVANIAGAVSSITTSDLTASRALVSGSGGKVEVSAVTATELGHLDGVSSAIQTQLNGKQATITGAATTIDDTNLTASRALVSDGSGKVAVSAVTSTELGRLDGVTSGIQTQLNAKLESVGTSDIDDNAVTVGKLAATIDLGVLS